MLNELIIITFFIICGISLVVCISSAKVAGTCDEWLHDDYERDKDDKGTL